MPWSINLFPKPLILDSSKLKELLDNNFKFGNEEFCIKQFLLFLQCFQEACTCTADMILLDQTLKFSVVSLTMMQFEIT